MKMVLKDILYTIEAVFESLEKLHFFSQSCNRNI